jgi:D-aminopeptidase
MYATPSTAEGGGALGGQRIGEKDMEEYLLGKKRVDEVLKQGDNVSDSHLHELIPAERPFLFPFQIGAAHEQFIAVQNANTAQDIAAKVREDPLLAIKRQEQLAYQAMMNNPALKRQVKAIKEKNGETKEERREKKRRDKEVGYASAYTERNTSTDVCRPSS